MRPIDAQMPASEPDPIWLLVAGTVMLMGAGAAVFTLMADLQETLGFAEWGFGAIASSFFLSSLVAQVGLASLADRGHARHMLLGALVLSIASLIWFAFAKGLVGLVAARALQGFAFGIWAPAARATAVRGETTRAGERLGLIATGETSALVVGPLLAAGLASFTDLRTAYLVFAGLVAVTLVGVRSRARPDQARPGTENGPLRPLASLSLLRHRPSLQAAVLAFALFLPVGLYETVWADYVQELGGSTTIIALSVAIYGFPYAIVAPFGGRLGDRVGSVRVALVGSVLLAIITLLTGLPRTLWMLFAIGAVEATINACAYPNALAAMAHSCGEDDKAAGQGLAGGAGIAGAGVMALAAGPLWQWAGPTWSFAAAASLVATGGITAWAIGRGI